LSLYDAPSSSGAGVKSIPLFLHRELTMAGGKAERRVRSKPQVLTQDRCLIDRLRDDLGVGMAKS